MSCGERMKTSSASITRWAELEEAEAEAEVEVELEAEAVVHVAGLQDHPIDATGAAAQHLEAVEAVEAEERSGATRPGLSQNTLHG